jgi:hypothetical protein
VRPRRKVTDNGDGLPLHLLAGRCIKVWSPESGDWHEAWRRFGLAGRHWNAEHLGGLLVTFDVPWSYVFVRESRGDDGLTERLARLGCRLAGCLHRHRRTLGDRRDETPPDLRTIDRWDAPAGVCLLLCAGGGRHSACFRRVVGRRGASSTLAGK